MPGTSVLIVETSTPHASLAIAGADGGLTERAFSSDRSHNALLFGPLAELLDPLPPGRIGTVLVGSGPGSYSGTRVGIAAAQGVAMVNGCQAVAVPSILAVPAACGDTPCLVIGDARRGSYWTARVAVCQMLEAPTLTDATGLITTVAAAAAQGVPVVSFEDPARFPLPERLFVAIRQEFPSATRLWHAWCSADEATRRTWAAAPPQPIYLKPPHITPGKRPWLVPL
ncbi:MAG: tRNA (adenosine(37)-N6)-threonylcarbamoyltransferase complex dimerization subunit type 1 TsaB [Verrucomicrobiota bacterium]